jgi:hypothetical protein
MEGAPEFSSVDEKFQEHPGQVTVSTLLPSDNATATSGTSSVHNICGKGTHPTLSLVWAYGGTAASSNRNTARTSVSRPTRQLAPSTSRNVSGDRCTLSERWASTKAIAAAVVDSPRWVSSPADPGRCVGQSRMAASSFSPGVSAVVFAPAAPDRAPASFARAANCADWVRSGDVRWRLSERFASWWLCSQPSSRRMMLCAPRLRPVSVDARCTATAQHTQESINHVPCFWV